MARIFLKFYVAIVIFMIVLSIFAVLFSGEVHHVLSNDDWIIFIIACGALAISESIDDKK